MKKILFTLCVTILVGAFTVCNAYAADIDLGELSDTELVDLLQKVNIELVERKIVKSANVPAGKYIVGVDLPAGKYVITRTYNDSLGDYFGVYPNENKTKLGDAIAFKTLKDKGESFVATMSDGNLFSAGAQCTISTYTGISFDVDMSADNPNVTADNEVERTAPSSPEKSTSAESSRKYIPGTYTAEADGYGGKIIVAVTVDADSIMSVEIDGSSETKNIGSAAVAVLPDEIINANSADVDDVSGASVTSAAIRAAVSAALDDAVTGNNTAEVDFSNKSSSDNSRMEAAIAASHGLDTVIQQAYDRVEEIRGY